MNDPLPNHFLLLNMIFLFFFVSWLSALSWLFSLVCKLIKGDNHNIKKNEREQIWTNFIEMKNIRSLLIKALDLFIKFQIPFTVSW